MNESIATEYQLGGWASGCSTICLPALRNGFSASGLRRNWEIALAILCPAPRSRGSSAYPASASAAEAASRMIPRAQASASTSDLTIFWNSKSSAGSSSRLSSRNSTRSPSLNGRLARGQPS